MLDKNTTYNSHNSSSNRRQQRRRRRRQHRQSKPPRRLRPTPVTNRRRRSFYRWKKFSQKQNKKQETNSVHYEENGMLVPESPCHKLSSVSPVQANLRNANDKQKRTSRSALLSVSLLLTSHARGDLLRTASPVKEPLVRA